MPKPLFEVVLIVIGLSRLWCLRVSA